MGLSRHQPDHEQTRISFTGRLWAFASLVAGIPALAALALFEESGGDPKPPEPTPPTPPQPPSGSGDQPFRTFADQAEFDKHALGIKKAAERDAHKAIADQLGCTIDEAKQFLADRANAEAAKLTEVEKREQAAAKREQDAATREAEANRRARLADVSLALTTTGVRADRVTYATNAVMADLAEDADAEAIGAQVEKVKEAIPEFFGQAPANTPPAPNLGGAPRNNGSNGGRPTGIEAGRERAKALRGTKPSADADPFAGLGRVVGA